MATAPVPHSPVLRRLADDLGAETVESRLTPVGELIAEMRAMGHRFRFRVEQGGSIIERSCHADESGILSHSEMHVLWQLAHAELARREHGHLSADRHGADVFTVLSRAEVKMSFALADHLSTLERNVVAQALDRWSAHVAAEGSPKLGNEVRDIVAHIQRKLGA